MGLFPFSLESLGEMAIEKSAKIPLQNSCARVVEKHRNADLLCKSVGNLGGCLDQLQRRRQILRIDEVSGSA